MKKTVFLLALLLAGQANAQTIDALGAGRGSVVDADLFPSYQGANPAVRPSAAQIKTYANTSAVRATTTTGEALANSDQNKLVTFSNAAAVACTIAQAGSGGNFAAGWAVSLRNLGAGAVTCTPSTSTVDGAANFVLTTGQGLDLYSDGTNYFTQGGKGGSATTDASLLTSGTLAAARLPAFTGDCTTAAGSSATTCADPPHPGYISARWYQPANINSLATGGALQASRITCHFAVVAKQVTITDLGVSINTAGSSNIQLAIYSNASGRPANLIGNTGSIVNTSGNTAITGALAANKNVGPGGSDGGRDLWFCANQNDSTASYASNSTSNVYVGSIVGAAAAATLVTGAVNNAINGIYCTGAGCQGGSSTFGSWPAALGSSTWVEATAGTSGNIVPQIFFKVQ